MSELSFWRDISIVLLAIEIIIGLVPIVVILYFCITYLPRGLNWLQGFFFTLRGTVHEVQLTTLKAGRSIISPIITISRFVAAGKGMIRGALAVMRGK